MANSGTPDLQSHFLGRAETVVEDVEDVNQTQPGAQTGHQTAEADKRELGPDGRLRQHGFADHGRANVAVILPQIDAGDLVQQHVAQVAEELQIVFEQFELLAFVDQGYGFGPGLFEICPQRGLVEVCLVQLLSDHLH